MEPYQFTEYTKNNVKIIVNLIENGHKKIITQDGYKLYLMKYIAEQEESLIFNIISRFIKVEFKDTIQVAIDFLYFFIKREDPYNAVHASLHLTIDNSYPEMTYQDLIEYGKKKFHIEIRYHYNYYRDISKEIEYNNAAILINVLTGGNIRSYIVRVKETYVDLSYEDVVRSGVYGISDFKGQPDVISPYRAVNRGSLDYTTLKINIDLVSPIKKYILSYRRPSRENKDIYLNMMNIHLISDLSNIVIDYLFTLPLMWWSKEVGMIFPDQIMIESQRHEYYFSNIIHYEYVINNEIPERARQDVYNPYAKLTDQQLSNEYSKEHKINSWNSRIDLLRQVMKVNGIVDNF